MSSCTLHCTVRLREPLATEKSRTVLLVRGTGEEGREEGEGGEGRGAGDMESMSHPEHTC